MFLIVHLVAIAWGIAAAIKGVVSLRSNEPFRLDWWDGGILLKRKTLGRKVVWGHVAVGALLATYGAAVLLHFEGEPFPYARFVVIAVLAIQLGLETACAHNEPAPPGQSSNG